MKEFEEYVEKNWSNWGQTGLAVAALGLGGEAGECQEHIKKYLRGSSNAVDVAAFKLELGDVLHYLVVLAKFHGMTLAEIAEANVKKLDERFGRGK